MRNESEVELSKNDIFVVMDVKSWVQLSTLVNGTKVTSKLDLKFADGMIGMLPVFVEKEKAEQYADGLHVMKIETKDDDDIDDGDWYEEADI
ncbi:MAG: hypothetical protein PVI90_16885 [Desulfobacteraceae bacterium]|jgi:hypothetical protein